MEHIIIYEDSQQNQFVDVVEGDIKEAFKYSKTLENCDFKHIQIYESTKKYDSMETK